MAGFVQAGAEITGAGAALSPALFRLGRGDARLRLQPPGDWYERVRGLRLMTGPGRPFTTYDWDLSSAVRVA